MGQWIGSIMGSASIVLSINVVVTYSENIEMRSSVAEWLSISDPLYWPTLCLLFLEWCCCCA